MSTDLEHERVRLLARMAELETEHVGLHDRPDDHEGHQKHLESLRAYQDDVRAYRRKLAAERRERAIPDPEPF